MTASPNRPLSGRTAYRDVPADFADHAAESNVALGLRYGLHKNTIARMRQRAGLPPAARKGCQPKTRQMPEGFAEVASSMSINALAAKYRTGAALILRWQEEAGITRHRIGAAVPEDFAATAEALTLSEAEARWGVGVRVIQRWEREAGVKCRRCKGGAPFRGGRKQRVRKPKPVAAVREKPVAFERAPAPKRVNAKPRGVTLSSGTPQRDMTRAGQAAEYLRRDAPVYRCNEVGAQSIGGKFWRYGNSLPLTEAELLERAARKGFDPDAWSRIAA